MFTCQGIVKNNHQVSPMLPEWCSLRLHVRRCEVVAARPAPASRRKPRQLRWSAGPRPPLYHRRRRRRSGRRTPGQETAAFPPTTWGLSLAGPGPVPAHQPSLLIQQRPDWHRSQSGAVTHIYHRPFKLLLPRHSTLNNTRIFSFVPIVVLPLHEAAR